MTLTKLKFGLKVSGLLTALVIYGLGAYVIGRTSAGKIASQVKGVRTQAFGDSKIEMPQPYSDVQSSQVISSYVKLCANTVSYFELSYPKDWFTTYNDKYQECTYFAPFSFVVPSYIEHDITPIHIETVDPKDWQQTVKLNSNPNDFQNVLLAKNIEINGKSVTVVDSKATGAGFVPQGFVKRAYLIFDSKTPLIIYYQQLSSSEDTNAMEKVLEDMVNSLKFF